MSWTNPQEVLSHTAEENEMENTVGLEDTQRKMRKELYSERLWVKKQMKTHFTKTDAFLELLTAWFKQTSTEVKTPESIQT